jgi:phage recombination protein Bet
VAHGKNQAHRHNGKHIAMANALTISPTLDRPKNFNGTEATWRNLCHTYSAAETSEAVMMAVERSQALGIDPFAGAIHIIPMWNSKLRRRVQVPIPGIKQHEIVASRTGQWAGMDRPEWGPEITQTFRGETEERDGSTKTIEMTLTYPEYCVLTVYRLVGGQKRAFTVEVYWLESYGRAGFRSEVPNDRWQKAPRQMLHKVAKSAALRSAFPEQVGHSAEEMDGQEIASGGVTIDGVADYGTTSAEDQVKENQQRLQRDRQQDRNARANGHQAQQQKEEPRETDQAYATPGIEELDRLGGDAWLKKLLQLLTAANALEDVVAIGGHPTVGRALAPKGAPTTIQQIIVEAMRVAHDRVSKTIEPEPDAIDDDAGGYGGDGESTIDLEALISEVEQMDAVQLAGLPKDPAWQEKVRGIFPPDAERIAEVITLRKMHLDKGKTS